jgi:hypothetical protein
MSKAVAGPPESLRIQLLPPFNETTTVPVAPMLLKAMALKLPSVKLTGARTKKYWLPPFRVTPEMFWIDTRPQQVSNG